MKHFISAISSLLLAASLLALPVCAEDAQVVWGEVYCFSTEDLTMDCSLIHISEPTRH